MTERGTHRAAGVVDLLLAATAELSGLALVHHDHDFAEITKVTGQATVWLAEPGSIADCRAGAVWPCHRPETESR
jgi:hypothetical protein